MKKVFSIFLVFATFFIVSCGGLLDEEPRNTVRITMPGNGRAVSASGASDVNYYNIVIQNQTFSNVQAGSTVESAQLPVGMSVSISVEAIGNITTSTSGGQSGGAVGTTTTTVVSNGRIAYYQTSERLPAEGLTLSINMANYKTEYYEVSLEPNGFNGQNTQEVYVAGGSGYTLPDYGTNSGTPPQKHTGWKMYGSGLDNPPFYPVGASVTITGDRQFDLVSEDFATISYNSSNFGVQVNLQYQEKNTDYTLKDLGINENSTPPKKHTGWTYNNGADTAKPGDRIRITGDMSFTVVYVDGIELDTAPWGASVQSIEVNDSIYESNGKYYIWKNEPFIMPKGTKNDGSPVEKWILNGNSSTLYDVDKSYPYDSSWENTGCSCIPIQAN